MTPETRERLEALLAGQRLLALGVVVEGAPVVGLVPYALAADRTALYIQASRLAAHSRGLETGSRWSGVLQRFPAAAMTLQLGDSALYRLELESGRLILGFGQAFNLSRTHFTELASR